MVTTFYPPYTFGGDGVYVQRLANGLAERGHEVEVVHCVDSYRLMGRPPVSGLPDHPTITVHALESPFGFLSPLATQQTGLPLFKAGRLQRIMARGFDVIHYHNISLVGGPGILGYGDGVKLYTPHEYWLVCRNHILFRNNRAVCTEPRCLLCDLFHRRPPPLWRYTGLLDRSLRHVDAFLASTRFVIDMHKSMGLNSIPFVHLPHFAPPKTWTEPKETSLAAAENGLITDKVSGYDGKPYFLYVGRLERIKGVDTLLSLFRHWRQASLLIAGSGAQESELRRLAQGSDNIVFLGCQNPATLARLYRGATALIIPSVCHEMSALVSLEAMTQGTPIIARAVGGMPEVVEETGGGVVYSTEDGLMACMEKMLDEPAFRQLLGERGMEACRTHRSLEVHINRYLDIINVIAARKAAGG